MLVADTIVVLKNQILGKPQTLAEATKMLKSLSGREHKVSTAFILARPDQIKPQVDIVETLVSFHVLSPGQIKSYVASREPMDKAGAYGFQGAALKFIRSVKGPYSNIVGLPLEALRARALALGARESAADDHG